MRMHRREAKTAGSASDQLPKNCSNEGQFSRIGLDVFDTDRKMFSLQAGVEVPSLRIGVVKLYRYWGGDRWS
jgi:hypothetical protein